MVRENETTRAVRARHARDIALGQRRASITGGDGQQQCHSSTGTRKTADRGEHALVLRQRATQQGSPRKVDRHLVGNGLQRDVLDGLAHQQEIRQLFAHGPAGRVGKRITGGVETDREDVRPCARHVKRVAPVSRAGVDRRARKRADELSDLTDVDVDEAFPDELTHHAMLGRKARFGRPASLAR